MAYIEDLRITVNNINRMLTDYTNAKVGVMRSYGERRLAIWYEDGGEKHLPCHGAKECLKYAEGMEAALELIGR